MPNTAVTLGAIFGLSVLVDVALHLTSPTGAWPGPNVVVVIVGVVGIAVLVVRWGIGRARPRTAPNTADRAE